MDKWRLTLVVFAITSVTSVVGQGITPSEAKDNMQRDQDIIKLVQSIKNNPSAFKDYIADEQKQRTLLMFAAQYGASTVVSALLDAGSDVDLMDLDSKTALIWGIRSGDSYNAVVNILTTANANVNLPKYPFWSPLHYACSIGNSYMVKAILAKNPDVNREDINGMTPLIIAAKESKNVIKLLTDAGANVDHQDHEENTALVHAAVNWRNFALSTINSIVDALLAANASYELPRPPLWGPLQFAAKRGYSYVMRKLIAVGADVDRRDALGKTALLIAADNRQTVLDVLIDAGANVDRQSYAGHTALIRNINQYHTSYKDKVSQNHDALMDAKADFKLPRQPGWSPLQKAADQGATYIVKSLIAANADVNETDHEGKTPLIIAAERRRPVLDVLIEAGADVDHLDMYEDTALTKLIRHSHISYEKQHNPLVNDLLNASANIHLPKAPAWSPLHWAAHKGFSYVVKSLTKASADVTRKDEEGKTPLILAAIQGRPVVQHLIDYGADVDTQDYTGRTALSYTAEKYRIYGRETDRLTNLDALLLANASVELPVVPFWGPLHHAAEKKSKYMIEKLIEAEADVNREDQLGVTPLLVAAKAGNVVIEPFLKEGANANHMDFTGETAVLKACRHAAESEAAAILSTLLEADANPDLRVSTVKSGLHWAASRGNADVVKVLLEDGASVSLQDNAGYTPLITAASSRKVAVVKLLLNGGSDVNALSYKDGTAIHRLVYRSDSESLGYAMQFCPNLNLTDGLGKTPHVLASDRNNQAIIRILEDEYVSVCVHNMEVYKAGEIRCGATEAYKCTQKCQWEEVQQDEVTNCTFTTPPSTSATPDIPSCETTCVANYDPVCGSDGLTYSNLCVFGRAKCNDPNLAIKHNGVCGITTTPKPECLRSCPAIYDPVCGSDDVTYDSLCQFNNAQCNDPTLTFKQKGVCVPVTPQANPCYKVCPAIYNPVCGSNEFTYNNTCYFDIAKCEDQTLTMKNIGACVPVTPPTNSCYKACIDVYDPVCGSNGITYSNECYLDIAKCEDPTLTMNYKGECVPVAPPANPCYKACIAVYDPVCGSNGITYSNECYFDIAKCQDPTITMKHKGECEADCKNGGVAGDIKPNVNINVNVNFNEK